MILPTRPWVRGRSRNYGHPVTKPTVFASQRSDRPLKVSLGVLVAGVLILVSSLLLPVWVIPGVVLGLLVVVASAAFAYRSFRHSRHLRDTPGLVLDATGFATADLAPRLGRVAWDEVRDWDVRPFAHQLFIRVYLHDTRALLARLPSRRDRRRAESVARIFGTPVLIWPSHVKAAEQDVIAAFDRHSGLANRAS